MHDPAGAFSEWLAAEMRARRMSVRQLAQRAGVAASTVSRVLRGYRRPTLRTTLKLARAMGPGPAEAVVATLVGGSNGEPTDPAGLVERALRSDDLLQDVDVRETMAVYLDLRARRRARGVRRAGSLLESGRQATSSARLVSRPRAP